MTNLKISKSLSLTDDYVTKTAAILAQRRKGKTYSASVIAEEMVAAKIPFVALDPTGSWWGLRSSADGKKPGLPVVILGGQHGDLPLERGAGKFIADLVLDYPGWYVIDFSLFESGAGERQFATDFAERLFRRKAQPNMDFPMHLFVDEADRFCMTADTEILTDHGWATWDQVHEGTVAVGFDMATEEYRYEPVRAVLHRYHDGEMIGLKTKSLDCLVTPDHRLVLRRQQRAAGRYKKYDWSFCPAGEVPTSIEVPAGGAPPGIGVPDLSNEVLRIMGWVITDGHWHDRRKSKVLALQQSTATVKRGVSMTEEMSTALDQFTDSRRYLRPSRVGPKPGGGEGTITGAESYSWYFGHELSDAIGDWLGEDLHRIPRRILEEGSPEQLSSLYQGLMEGDGTSDRGVWVRFYPGKNEQLADEFQELATRLGISTTKRFEKSNGQWTVNVCRRTSSAHWVRRPYRATYKGLVWDITLPSGAFVARRNGRVFVTGNCPQRVGGGRGEARETDQRLLGAFEAIVRRGGIRGLGTTLISQRAAVVNKNVLEQIDVLIALRVVGPNDRRAIEDYLKSDADDEQRRAMMGSLSSLGLGEAWIWEPGGEPPLFDRVQIRERHTFNSSATPKPGQKRVEPSKFAAVDLSAVKDQMAEAIQRAEANDPKALQRRIVELEKQLAAKPAVLSEPQIVTERIEVPVPFIPEGLLDDLLAEVQKGLEGASVLLSGHVKRVVGSHVLDARLDGESKSSKAPKRAVISAPTPSIATTERAGKSNNDLPTQMGKAERSILSVLAQFADGRTRSQVATLSGYSAKSSSFGNALSRLRTLGYINKSGEPIRATNEGIDAIAGQYEPLPTGRALLDHWNSKLGKAERIILGVAIEAWPASLSREEVAKLSGYSETSSSFGNALSKLRTLELISGRGEILAEDTLAREAGR